MDWYPHQKIEKEWQERWEKEQPNRAKDFSKKEKAYVMVEFPYPSGDGLHVGHVRSYAALDALARKKRLEGKNVLYPIGWDAFGLPTENYAIKTGQHPRIVAEQNIATFKRQLKALGISFDWSREVNTTDPKYYLWTQWIFLQLLKRGLAYQDLIPINWCPKDKIGLANEEVIGGKCERCGTQVVRKLQKQWMLKITAYAERLLKDLDTVNYLDKIKAQQVNWIGKSEGAEVQFRMKNEELKKVLLATNNPSKVERVKMLLARALPDVQVLTPKEAGLDALETEEGDDLTENAIKKAKAYVGKTDMPIIGMDMGFFIDGVILDPARVKRNALGKADERSMSAKEIGERMFEYYRKMAKDHGGEVPGYFLDVFALVQPDGTVQTSESRRDLILTDKKVGEIDYHFPIRALYKAVLTGKYISEQTKEEEITIELAPYTKALVDLLNPSITVFTTRPDTLFGATYLVLAPEHGLIQNEKLRIKNWDEVQSYIQETAKKSDLDRTDLAKEKTGVELKGITAINPANNEEIPIWVADYVLSTYGTGAIMAVPAHDERDWEFAKKYSLQLRAVVLPSYIGTGAKAWMADNGVAEEGNILHTLKSSVEMGKTVYSHRGSLVNSGEFDGLTSDEASVAIIQLLEKRGQGKKAVQYKLRDWVFSRQHYWGEPIPVVHCDACKERVVSEAHTINFFTEKVWERLVTGLKTVETRALNPDEPERFFGKIGKGDYLRCVNKNTGEIAFFRVVDAWTFKNLKAYFKRKDLMGKSRKGGEDQTLEQLREGYAYTPNYVDRIEKHGLIAWEIERVIPGVVPDETLPVELPHVEKYLPTDTGESPLAAMTEWVNTQCPECGKPAKRETDTMPNWAGSSWYFLRYCDSENNKAFADKKKLAYWMPVDVYNGGMEHTVLHLLYSRFWNKFLYDQGLVPASEPYKHRHSHGIVLAEDNQKMSKSRGNVINPDAIVKEYGADSLRVYEMFMGPFEDTIPWSTRGIVGVHRFLQGVYDLFQQKKADSVASTDAEKTNLVRWQNKATKKVGEDLEGFRFNTAVSTLMEFVNVLRKISDIPDETRKTLLLLLFPMAPHLASELWEKTYGGDITKETWPTYDESKLVESAIQLIVQVNGKVRARIVVAPDISEADARSAALADANVKKFVTAEAKKVVYVPGKLVNIVV